MTDESYSTWRRRLLAAARLFIALSFAAVGTAKFLALAMMVTVFDHIGFSQRFR